MGAPLGKFDAVLTTYSPDHTRSWTCQFGTPDDDAADPFAEANVYLTATPTRVHLSGLTNTDVFHTTFTPAGRNESP